MGGGKVCGIGWACGVERLSMLLEKAEEKVRPIAVVPLGEDTFEEALKIAYRLRKLGFAVEHSYSGNIKKRMTKANKVNAFAAVIIGSDELQRGVLTLKNLDSGEQREIKIDDLEKEIK